MTDRIVTLKITHPQEILDTDQQGSIVEHARASMHLAIVECAITSETFNVATAFRVSLPKDRVPQVDNIANALAYFACLAIPRYFASYYIIDLFSLQNLTLLTYLDDKLPDLSDNLYDYREEINCHLSKEAYDRLLVQADEYANAKNAFEHAVEKLTEYSRLQPTELADYSSNVHQLLRFIDACLNAADLGYMSGWYSEKQPRIKTSFNDLMRRKQASHPNYIRAQEYICRTLYSYSAPRCWLCSPPSANMILAR